MPMKKTKYIFTKDDLKEKFERFNKAYFHGRMKTPKFKINSWGTCYAGSFFWDDDGTPYISLSKSGRQKMTEEKVDRVLLHEMIHYYCEGYLGIKFWLFLTHGPLFQLIRIHLNLKYGLHIK